MNELTRLLRLAAVDAENRDGYLMGQAADRIDELESRVEILENIEIEIPSWDDDEASVLRATVAELESRLKAVPA
jgi:hypothetical protein